MKKEANIRMYHALLCVTAEIYTRETAPLIKRAHNMLKNINHIVENFGEGDYLDTFRQISYNPFKKELDKLFIF